MQHLETCLLCFTLLYDYHCCSEFFELHLFADDANLFYKSKTFSMLESNINAELNNIHIWLCANITETRPFKNVDRENANK